MKVNRNFGIFLVREAEKANQAGAGFILQMDSNCHLGNQLIENDPNPRNANGKLVSQFLERLPQLTLINTLSLCEGLITRMRKTTQGVELKIDERRETYPTNFAVFKKTGKLIESDHNVSYWLALAFQQDQIQIGIIPLTKNNLEGAKLRF